MVNIIASAVILLLFCFASYYIYREKKRGRGCIGCPMSGNCHKNVKCKE